jgi:hypothetical protein
MVYVIIRHNRVSMCTSDYQLNATQILLAANLDTGKRSALRRRLKLHCEVEVVGRSSWVPFTDGVLLCRAVGLAVDLEPLLSLAPTEKAVPGDRDNYLLETPQGRGPPKANAMPGYEILQWQSYAVFYAPSTGAINATQLVKAGGVVRHRLEDWLAKHPDRPRTRLTGKPQRLKGFWINLTDALPLCRQFNLDDGLTNLVQGLLAKCAAGLDCAKPASNCGQAAAADAEELREPL